MSDLLSLLTGMPARVNCDSSIVKAGQAEGEYHIGHVTPLSFFDVPFAPPVTTVRNNECDRINMFLQTTKPHEFSGAAYETVYDRRAEQFVGSIAVLLHEAEHMRQVRNEAAATCYAVQKMPGALQKLGMTQSDIDKYAPEALKDKVLRFHPEYISIECRPGGDLDIGVSDLYLFEE